MSITLRPYGNPGDFDLISTFLVENFQSGNADGNWLQPAWEYMHSHPDLDEASLAKIGVWEDSGKVVGAVHYESQLGEAFFELHADYVHLKPLLLAHAGAQLYKTGLDGTRRLNVFVNDFDRAFEALVRSQGYEKDGRRARPMSQLTLTHLPGLTQRLPDGFQLKSLDRENDLVKIHRVLWRGFNHLGEPPPGGVDEQRKMQSGPHFRKDLTLVVAAPNGEYVSYCGMWYEARNRIAYVEPVATDPAFRRKGLAAAALLEGLRRCRALGAQVAFVGSDQEFYRMLGFQKLFTANCWAKSWGAPQDSNGAA